MPWTVLIHREARRILGRLNRATRQRIAERIQALGNDPDDPALSVKAMAGRPGYRLRVGGWRILFTRDDDTRVIAIHCIGIRGDVYK